MKASVAAYMYMCGYKCVTMKEERNESLCNSFHVHVWVQVCENEGRKK